MGQRGERVEIETRWQGDDPGVLSVYQAPKSPQFKRSSSLARGGEASLRSYGPSPRLLRAARPLAFVRVEEALPQADALGRDLDQLFVLDVSDRLFQRHDPGRG